MNSKNHISNSSNAAGAPFEMKNVCRNIIGVVGGMGSYATLHFFQKILDAFPVEKEWERPRLIIDNNCVMPSRVRAILYGERREELVEDLAASIQGLLGYNVDMIIMACNTTHFFLPDIRERVPAIDNVLVDLIRTVTDYCVESSVSELLVIASEGTVATRIYDSYCENHGIMVNYPHEKEQMLVREFIEDVKQKQWAGLPERFADYLRKSHYDNIVLGCTELSMIFDAINNADNIDIEKNVIDPVQHAVDSIRTKIMKNEA